MCGWGIHKRMSREPVNRVYEDDKRVAAKGRSLKRLKGVSSMFVCFPCCGLLKFSAWPMLLQRPFDFSNN